MAKTGQIQWRTANDGDADNEKHGLSAAITCEDASLTVQSFTEDADINVLARRFGITDIPLTPIGDDLIDTTQFPDLREILEARRAAANGFAALPIKIRKRFRNSPEELWNFLQDPDNADEAVRLGLLSRRAEPENSSPPTARGNTTDGTSPAARPAQESSTKEPEKTPKETPPPK